MPDLFDELPDIDESEKVDPGGPDTAKRRTTLCVTRSSDAGVAVFTLEDGVVARTERHPARVFDAAGMATTGEDGKVEFSLNDELAGLREIVDKFLTYAQPVNVVATADRGNPAIVTTRAKFTDGKSDIVIRLFSWDVDGSPKPNVRVRWRCNVPVKTKPVD